MKRNYEGEDMFQRNFQLNYHYYVAVSFLLCFIHYDIAFSCTMVLKGCFQS
jgi:hypothetical protein